MKRMALTALAGVSLALAACGGEAEVAEAPVEGVIEGVTIENARMVLAPVAGNPAAIYFDFAYDGDRVFSLDRFSVAGAQSAVMHHYGEWNFEIQMMEAMPVPVAKGDTVEFKPGELHVMVMGVPEDLAAGDSVEVTMKVSGGRTHVFTAEVRAAGDER